ncbi:hypothetical protein BC833DRAFT_586228 [Globomyces pollinis-pini]|nr:hypothetical protein BC833DRAFT_586228 [Globomyces pollinis-pini]
MSFETIGTPSGGVLIKGRLTQKKLTAKSKRQVMLCFPTSVQDVQLIHQMLSAAKSSKATTEEARLEESEKDMELYGHIALSAISGFPLLVIGTQARTFIHFSQIQGLYDEQDLKSACSFSLMTSQSEYRFFSETSTDYQLWVGALTKAFENMSAVNESYRPTEDENEPLARPQSVMSRNPEDYLAAHRSLTSNRSASRDGGRASRRLSRTSTSTSALPHWDGQQFVHNNSSSDLGPNPTIRPEMGRKISIFQKVKSIFKKSESKDNLQRVDSAELSPERGREPQAETITGRFRQRSKSAIRYLTSLGKPTL